MCAPSCFLHPVKWVRKQGLKRIGPGVQGGGGLRNWSGAKASSHKELPSGAADLWFDSLSFNQDLCLGVPDILDLKEQQQNHEFRMAKALEMTIRERRNCKNSQISADG